MIATANRLAGESGFGLKAKFLVGDAAKEDHQNSDIVVLDKVVCCYPSMEGLLSRASSACQERLGLIVPRDVGFARVPVRVGVYVDNLIDRIRKNPARMYLHSLDRVDFLLRGFGLRRKIGTVAGFSLGVRLLSTSHCCVDYDVLTVRVNPDWCNLWTPVSIHRRDECEVLAFEKPPRLFIQSDILIHQIFTSSRDFLLVYRFRVVGQFLTYR